MIAMLLLLLVLVAPLLLMLALLGLALALLPTDLLRHIMELQRPHQSAPKVQRGIGPRELCTLECTAWLFRQLADDDAWRHRVKPSAQTPTVK